MLSVRAFDFAPWPRLSASPPRESEFASTRQSFALVAAVKEAQWSVGEAAVDTKRARILEPFDWNGLMTAGFRREESGLQKLVNKVHEPNRGRTKYEETERFFID
jgi:hypothetical protein